MIYKIKTIYLTVILLILFITRTNAQVKIFYKNSLNAVKEGTTHVVVRSFDFQDVIKFYDTFKKNWKITKGIDFILQDSLRKNLKAGDSYFSIEHYIPRTKKGVAPTEAYFYLNFWIPTAESLKGKGNIRLGDEIIVAQFPLSVDTALLKEFRSKPKSFVFPKFDFDGSALFANWNPWILKNYLMELTTDLEADKQSDLTDNVDNIDLLKLLGNDVLYCTEDNIFSEKYRKDKIPFISNLFQDYQFNYKVIANRDLEEKILLDFEPVYYLLFFHNTTAGKVIAIIDSHTGEPIYMTHVNSKTFYLGSNDIRDLNRILVNAQL
jgi:hypothetical protein